MKEYKLAKWNSGINAFIFLSLGFLLLLFPEQSLSIVGYLIASILMLSAVSYFIKIYKNKGLETNGDIFYLIISIIFVALSITFFIDQTWLLNAINRLVGLILIITSSINIASLLKFRKDRTVSWWICLSFTIIIIIFGILTLIKPDLITKLITQIAGAALIIDTLITLIVTRKSNKVLLIKEQN